MKRTNPLRCAFTFMLLLVFTVVAVDVRAAKPGKGKKKLPPQTEAVEMFAAIESGDIEVRFIPKDAAAATVLIKNKTDKPLEIQLPEAFAGVPVLAQFFPGLCPPDDDDNGRQTVGGGFPGGMMMMGRGIFSVGPDKVRRVKVKTVCLEHSKANPNPRIKYEIVGIESFTKNSSVIELCKMLATGELSQNTAQAAAWHLANGLSWQSLAAKDRVRIDRIRYAKKFFTARELTRAKKAVKEAGRRAKADSVKTASLSKQ